MENSKRAIFLFIVLLTTCVSITKAQSASHMRMHQQAMHQVETMRRFRTEGMMGNTKKYHEKYRFFVINHEGDTIEIPKKIKISFFEPVEEISYKIKGEVISYKPDQTKEIFIKNGQQIVRGTPRDSCWLFHTFTTNKMKFYAPYPEVDIPYITHYQTNGDSIRVITWKALEDIVAGNTKAEKQAKKKKKTKALTTYIRAEYKMEKEKNNQ